MSARPDQNFGGAPSLLLGGDPLEGTRARVLVRFELSAIPAKAEITKVSLSLNAVEQSGFGPPQAISLHRMVTRWEEGFQTGGEGLQDLGGLALDGAVTWNNPGTVAGVWGEPGGAKGTDYVALNSGVGTLIGLGPVVIPSSERMIADVTAWIREPDSNRGWLLEPAIFQTTWRIGSRENSTEDLALTVEYTAPESPPVSTLSIRRSEGDLLLSFPGLSGDGDSYQLESVPDLSEPWQPLPNPNEPGDAVTLRVPVEAEAGFFRISVRR